MLCTAGSDASFFKADFRSKGGESRKCDWCFFRFDGERALEVPGLIAEPAESCWIAEAAQHVKAQ